MYVPIHVASDTGTHTHGYLNRIPLHPQVTTQPKETVLGPQICSWNLDIAS